MRQERSAGGVAIVLQAAVITTVVVKDHGVPGTIGLANKSQHVDGSFVVVSFVPQATVAEITKFLGAHKATVVEAPTRTPTGGYRIKVSDTKLTGDEVTRIAKQMQEESKIVSFIAAAN